MKPEFINGPTNYAYLKGNINGIEKDIYLFFDKHFELNDQTKCKSFNSIDISYYLYSLIKESKGFLDFFMEIRTSQIFEPISNKRDIYIKEVINLFKSEFVIKNSHGMKNLKYSKTNPKVRLHYFDIRDHLNILYLTNIITQINENIILLNKNEQNKNKQNNNEKNKKEYINNILFFIEDIRDKIKLLDANIKEVISKENIIYDKINDTQKYYLNKVRNQYNIDVVGKSINLFLDIHCEYILHKINQIINDIKFTLTNIYILDINELDKNMEKLSDHILELYSYYTDGYLLRRILDKNYVKKCIIYSGGAHSVNFIFFLVKHCGFKIITIHNCQEKNLNMLEEKINKEWYSFNVRELFLFKNNIQCIERDLYDLEDIMVL